MFTVKKTKEGLIVDLEKPHSTSDIHNFRNDGTVPKCLVCKKSLKEGDVCGMMMGGSGLTPAHEVCPK